MVPRSLHGLLLGVATGALLAGLVVPFATNDGRGSTVSAGPATAGSPLATPAAGTDEAGTAGGHGPAAAGRTGATDVSSPSSAGSPSRTPGGSSPSAGGSAVGAADVGVTDEVVRLGISYTDAGGTARFGFAFDTGDNRAIFQSFIDEANATGGIQGRRIEVTFRPGDPTMGADSWAQSCRALTEDDKVFAVVGNHNDMSCITREHRTLLLQPNAAATDEDFAASGGLLFTGNARGERILRSLARELHRTGALRGKTIGIVDDTFLNTSVDRSLLPALRDLGYQVAQRSTLSEDPGTAQSQIPVAVRTMAAKGVDLVVLGPNIIYAVEFVHAADSQAYRPAWISSDFAYIATDFAASNMPPSFDGSLGYTQLRTGETRKGLPQPDIDRACQDVAERRTGKTYDPTGTPYQTVQFACAAVGRFVDAARSAPALTRVAVADRLRTMTGFRTPFFGGTGSFVGKGDAADSFRPVRMSSACRCWLPAGDFLAMTG